MIIYKSAHGEGFNPLLHISNKLHLPMRLRSLTRHSRNVASVNIILSLGFILLSASWISGLLPLTMQSAFLSVVGLISWRAGSYMSLRHDKFEVSNLPEQGIFKVNVFTVEWFLFYMSLPLYLLSMQTMEMGRLANLALNAFAGISVVVMLIPLAQGSHYALTKKVGTSVTPARTTSVDSE